MGRGYKVSLTQVQQMEPLVKGGGLEKDFGEYITRRMMQEGAPKQWNLTEEMEKFKKEYAKKTTD